MPLYEYQCEHCGERFEKIQKFSDPPLDTCPKCGGGPVHKLIAAPAFQFKGTGWYITDYARKDSGGGKAEGSKDAASGNSSADKKAAGGEGTKDEKPAKSDAAKGESTPAPTSDSKATKSA